MAAARKHVALRIAEHQLARIDALASTHHMSRTEYMTCTAAGEMPAQRSEAIERIEALEREVERLGQLVELGAGAY